MLGALSACPDGPTVSLLTALICTHSVVCRGCYFLAPQLAQQQLQRAVSRLSAENDGLTALVTRLQEAQQPPHRHGAHDA